MKPDYETYEPESFLKFSKEYNLAATKLIPFHQDVNSPIYFLFMHSIELSFKAYLNIGGSFKKKTHSLRDLYEESVRNGFPSIPLIKNVIELSESMNEFHGFRYFIFKSSMRPEINYLAEAANMILELVIKELDKSPKRKPKSGVVGIVTWHKPSNKP